MSTLLIFLSRRSLCRSKSNSSQLFRSGCDGTVFVALEIKQANESIDAVLEALRPVAIKWLILFGPENTAEITLPLIQNHILLTCT